MRILITSDWYKPVINGVVTSVDNLCKGLTALGHEVRILTLSGSISSKKEGNVYYVGSIGAGMIYENARLKLMLPRQFLEEIREWRTDVIHSQCEFSTFSIARELARECQIPIVHTYHTIYEDYTHYFCPSHTVGRKLARLFSRWILSDVNAVIVPSGKIHSLLEAYGIGKPIYEIPSGIDMEQLRRKEEKRKEIRASLGIREEECILLYLGRMAKEKNIEELLGFLSKMDPKQRMLLVGDGPYRESLEKEAKEKGLSGRLIFTGMIDPKEAADYYAAGDIFVSASRSETQGLTYMEAMACELPLLCRADACLNEVIHPAENGLLYHSEEEFLQEAKKLAEDPELRRKLGHAARGSVEKRYSREAFAKACVRVYKKACCFKQPFLSASEEWKTLVCLSQNVIRTESYQPRCGYDIKKMV